MEETSRETDDKETPKSRVKKKRVRSSHSKKSLTNSKTSNSGDSETINLNSQQKTSIDTSRSTENVPKNQPSTAGYGDADSTESKIEDKLLDLQLDFNNLDHRGPNTKFCSKENNGLGRPKELLVESVEELNHLLHLTVGNLGDNLFHYGVTVLKLVDCDLTTLPYELGHLVSLEVINVSENKLQELPDSIGRLHHLYTLQAEFNRLTSLPKSIKDLKSLSILAVNDNSLKSLPDGISDLEHLDTLDVSNNVLQTLPAVFKSAETISRIYAQKNLLKTLPHWFTRVRNIKELHLGENQISAWSNFKTFGKVAKDLQMLDICENKLSMLGDSFDGLTELSCLNLGRNPFENQLKPWASGNFLTSLPNTFTQLKKVTLLSLDGNQLKSLPNNFGDLVNLKMINLVQNCLETLPDSFCQLQSLELCLLSRNCLHRLPKKFGNLPLLNHLEVSDNKLCELPTTFKNLVKLTYLDLSSNRLKKEPNFLHLLTHLNYLNLHSNPFEYSAGDIVDPELSYAYVGESAEPPRRGQFEDLDSEDEAVKSNHPSKKSQEVKGAITLTSSAVQMDHPKESPSKVEHHNGPKGNRTLQNGCRKQQKADKAIEEEEEEEGEEGDFDWEHSNGLYDVATYNSEERHWFMPSDLHRKNVHYNSSPFPFFPGQFDDADD